jgi:beta-1,4-mannosyl-glycoprotein beta-1,4-N-acetylglucosaminyltransferase
MVIDVCSFNGEYDLLEIRLNILDSVVDQFVIVEAWTTFSGNKKPLFYKLQEERYAKWHHKIKYHVIDENYTTEEIEVAESSPNVPKNMPWWRREFLQKESIKKALVHLKPDDIVFVSDCDEIWNPAILSTVEHYDSTEVYKLRQLAYAYYLNNRSDEAWTGTFVTTYQMFTYGCLNHFRTRFPKPIIEKGGWHFTNMGGEEEIRRKLESYGHQEYNNEGIKSGLAERIQQNKDFIGRPFKFWIDEVDLPEYIRYNKDKYKHLFKLHE